jgi:lysophospholipase L1-like esterase
MPQARTDFKNVAAGSTDYELVAGSVGWRYRVVHFVLSAGGTATAVTFKEKPSGGSSTAISATFTCPVNTPVPFPDVPIWFETATQGTALVVTTGAGSTVGIQFTYLALPDAPVPPVGVPRSLSVVAGTSTPTAGTGFTVTVTALDNQGNVVTGYAGTVHLTSTDGAAVLGADSTLTDGVGVFSVTLKTAGTQTVTALDMTTGVTGTTSFLAVGAGAPARLAFMQQPSAVVAGSSVSPAVTVKVLDANNNFCPTATNAVTLTLHAAGGATLTGGDSTAAVGGVATFSALKVDIAATYSLDAAASGLTGAASGNFTVSFSPLGFAGLLMSLKGNTNVYTDAAQAVAASSYGDLVREWHDERETAGGSTYPYGAQAASGLRPALAPTAFSNVGGVRFHNKNLAISGLTGVDPRDCTVVLAGCLYTDYARHQQGAFYFQAGGALATGMMLGTLGVGTANNGSPDAYYDGALVTDAGVRIPLGADVFSAQCTGASVALAVNGVDGSAHAAAASSSQSNGVVGDDANVNGACWNTFFGRVLVYSPALSAGRLAALKTGLAAEVTVGSLFPLTYPLVVFWGNSITVGVGHSSLVAPADATKTYPYKCMGGLTNPFGYLIPAVSTRSSEQLDTAFAAGIDAHYNAGRAKQVVIAMEIINSVANGDTGAQAYAALKSFCTARKAAGWSVLVCTAINTTDVTQAGIDAANTLLRADFDAATAQTRVFGPHAGVTWADYLVDMNAIPEMVNPNDATYYADGTHPTEAGYTVMGTLAKNALSLLGIT